MPSHLQCDRNERRVSMCHSHSRTGRLVSISSRVSYSRSVKGGLAGFDPVVNKQVDDFCNTTFSQGDIRASPNSSFYSGIHTLAFSHKLRYPVRPSPWFTRLEAFFTPIPGYSNKIPWAIEAFIMAMRLALSLKKDREGAWLVAWTGSHRIGFPLGDLRFCINELEAGCWWEWRPPDLVCLLFSVPPFITIHLIHKFLSSRCLTSAATAAR